MIKKNPNIARRLFKYFCFIVIFLVILLGLVGFFLKSIFTQEKVKKLAIDLAAKSLPDSRVNITDLKISLGWNFNIKIGEFSISDKYQEKPMVLVKNFHLQLPLYSILDQTPEISLNLDRGEIYIYESGPNEEIKKIENPPDKSREIPSDTTLLSRLLKKAQDYGDLLLKNSSVKLHSKEISLIQVFKQIPLKATKCQKVEIFFKNLSSPLFLKIKCQGDTGEKEPGLKGVITLTGEVNILELLENKNLKFNGSFILENPFYPPIGKIPTIRGEVKELLINTDGIRVPFQVMIDKWGKGSLILTNRSGETFLDSINFLFNFGVLDVLLDQMPFSRSGQFKLKGKISFLEKGFYPEISLKTKNLNVFYKNMKIPVFILGNIQGKNYNLKNQLRIFDGFIQSEIMGIINWENLSNPFGKTKINTKVTSLKLKLPAKKEKSDKETDFKYPIPKFPLEIDMELEKVNLEKIVLNGNGHLSTRKGGTSNLKMNLTFNDAPALIKAKLLKSKKNAHLDFKLKKFDLSDLENLLPKKLGNFTGKANLEFFGTFPFPSIKLKDFSFQVKFDAFNGNYNNPHLGENWEKFIKENEGLEKYISKDAQPFVDYERIHLIGEIKSGKILIDKFIFRAPEEKLLIHANGHLGIKEDTRSLVYLDFRDKMGITLPSLKKLFGMETLYFKLEGKGFKLKPDLVYTSSKVLQNIPIELPKTLLSPIDKLLIDPFRKKPKPENEKK